MCLELPESIPPPTQQLHFCRQVLQGLAVGLLALAFFSIVMGDFFQIIIYMLLVYMLLLSWSSFNWNYCLLFFFYCLISYVVVCIELIGIIQFYAKINQKNSVAIIYVVLQNTYYTAAIYFSHYCYRAFKQFELDGLTYGANSGKKISASNIFPTRADNLSQQLLTRQQRQANKFQAFRGAGVAIG